MNNERQPVVVREGTRVMLYPAGNPPADAAVFYGPPRPEYLHDSDECRVCRDSRAREQASAWERARLAAIPYLVVVTAIVLIALANGLLGYGPTP